MGKRQAAASSVRNSGKSGAAFGGGGVGAIVGALLGGLFNDADPAVGATTGATIGGAAGSIGVFILRQLFVWMGFGRVAEAIADATAASSPGGAAITGGELRQIAHATIDDVFGYIEGISDESEFGQLRDRLADKGVELGVLYEGDAPPDEPAVAPTA